ncbi:MAG TPA: MYXO-CTERM sorting domain-containing protein, partial [Nannocystis sp.]
LVWRPAAPLKPGAAHQVTGGFDNPDSIEDYCADDLLALDFEFTADMGPSQPLPTPEVSAVESVETTDIESLTTLVCCDGAFPEEGQFDCGYDGDYVFWNDGACAPTASQGALSVQLEAPLAVAPSTAALVVTSVRVDGEVVRTGLAPTATYSLYSPFCTEVEQRNLATGETVTSAKQCHGDAVVAQLGPQPLDPALVLAKECTGPAYVCEVTEDAYPQWDPDKCTPYEPAQETETPTTSDSDSPTTTASESDTSSSSSSSSSDTAGETPDDNRGCACTTTPADPTPLLGLLGLGLLRRRRPARKDR